MSPARFTLRLTAAIILINLSVIALTGLSLHQSHQYYQERAVTTAQNLSDVLENELTGVIEKIGVTLFAVKDEYEKQSAAGKIARQTLNTYIARVHSRLPHIDGLRIADERGTVVYGEDVAPASQASLADRNHFNRQRDNPNAGLVISRPVISRVNGKRVIVFTRRLNHSDGSFAGIVLASVTLDHLTKTFSELDVGKYGSISLRDEELSILARFPEFRERGGGDTEMPRSVREMLLKGRYAGTYIASPPTDRIERTLSFRKVSDYPLYIITDLAPDDYLAQWRHEVGIMSALAALFALITMSAAWLIYRTWKRQANSVEALANQETKFRTVADFTLDWEYWEGPDHEILYMTPSCERVTGYSQAEFVADPGLLLRVIHPEDRHVMDQHLHDIAHQAYQDGAQVDFRIVRRDGQFRWISHHCRAITGQNGESMGRRVGNRDITERKLMESIAERERIRLQTILRTASDGIHILDKDGLLVEANEAFLNMLGYDGLAIGKLKLTDWAQTSWAECKARMSELITQHGKLVFEARHRRRNGEVFDVEISARAIEIEGKDYLYAASRDITERKRAEAQLQELNETLESRVNEAVGKARTLALRLLQVQDEERKHLARELHDETGQLLSAMSLCSHGILIQSENKEVAIHENAEFIIECIAKTQGAIHDVIHSLRPSLLSVLGLADSLRDLAGSWQKQNSQVTLELSLEDDSDHLNDQLNVSIYRFVQEGLTNVAKHAEASHVSVQLHRETGSDELILTIADNGKGLDLASHSEGFGLRGMQERATAVGGELTISSQLGKGVHIVARLPVNPNFEVLPSPSA